MTRDEMRAICAAYDEECNKRRPYWLFGVPEECDLRGVSGAVAKALGVSREAVASALEARLRAVGRRRGAPRTT